MSEHSCAEILSEVYQFIDGELTEERAELIQAHLTECLSCLEAFDFESEIKRVFALRARVCCPEELRTRLVLLLAERDAGHDA